MKIAFFSNGSTEKENRTMAQQASMCLLFLTIASNTAMAQTLPWESPICGLATAFRGPWAIGVATVAFAAAAAMWAFGEELTGIAKRLATTVMAVSLTIGSSAMVGWIAAKVGGGGATCT